MATVKYEDLLPDIIPMVPGCTDTLIENTIRNTVIELCEKSEVYQAELDPVDTVANTYEYDFEPPTGTVVHKILWATYDGNDLEAVSSSSTTAPTDRALLRGFTALPDRCNRTFNRSEPPVLSHRNRSL